MPHQCVHCGELYPDASKELIAGCKCGSHFFFFIRKEQYEKLKLQDDGTLAIELKGMDKKKIEKDVREIIGVEEEEPVVLDLEAIRVLEPGKFEIDVVNLLRKDRPIIYKLEEGKYIIDIATMMKPAEGKIV